MIKKKFRFKTEYFKINENYNVPGIIISSGFGLCFETYCCENCGEIFVLDMERLYHQKTNFEDFISDKFCPTCKIGLKTNITKYPENIFAENKILVNKNEINKTNFQNTELIDVYQIE
jgi:hypothetical protein